MTAAYAEAQAFERETYAASELAVSFLASVRPDAPHVLTSILPDSKPTVIETKTFNSPPQGWLRQYHGVRNIYWTPATLRHAVTKKPTKTDVKELSWLWCDIDPRDGESVDDAKARIIPTLTHKRPRDLPAPTIIVASGGGIQAFWALEQPLAVNGEAALIAAADGYLRYLALLLGGDMSCAECSHIMRVAGTINVPKAEKRARGRLPVLAKLLERDMSRVYPISVFKQALDTHATAARGKAAKAQIDIGDGPRRLDTIDELDQWDIKGRDRIKIICVNGHHCCRARWLMGDRAS